MNESEVLPKKDNNALQVPSEGKLGIPIRNSYIIFFLRGKMQGRDAQLYRVATFTYLSINPTI
jgi:hypothetical protein